jgi:Flp pilus assembly protein TadD
LPGEWRASDHRIAVAKQTMTLAQAFDAGMAALRRGDRDNAESIFQQVLAAKPDHAPSTHFLGVIGFQRGRHDEGIDLMRQGIAQRPDEAAFHQNLGGALRQIGRDAEALSALQTATRLAPADATAAANLATVFYRLGRHDEALAEGRRTLTLKDEQSRARDIAPIAPEEATVPPFRADQPERNIIAFSLWGDVEEYLTGALENARLVAEIYPG